MADGLRLRFSLAGAVLVVLAAAAFPALASAAAISGTVRDDSPVHAPIQGIQVCLTPIPYTFEVPCMETNSAGGYSFRELRNASYELRLWGDRYNLNYVTQSYPGNPITVAGTEVRTADVEMQTGGRIFGTVTEAGTGTPIAGVEVCASAPAVEGWRCSRSVAGGVYMLAGLPSGSYRVEFRARNQLNYQDQYYAGSGTFGGATLVPVVAKSDVAGIDATLLPGAEITGTLIEAGTGKPLPGIAVTLYPPASEEREQWVETDAAGRYAFRGLPDGEHVVAFSRPRYIDDNDCYSTQYYAGAATLATATVLHSVPGYTLNGIDGIVALECVFAPPPPAAQQSSTPPPSSSPAGNKPRRKALRCRTGFRKKRVHGKPRCVKRHKRHHRSHPNR